MPYKVISEDNGFNVYKLDANGNPDGEPMSDEPHKTKREATAQMRALYAAEKKELEPDELETKMYDTEPEMATIAGPVSFAELEAMHEAMEVEKELQEMTVQFGNLATNIMARPDIEDKAKFLSDLAAEYAGIVQDKMAMREEKGKSLWQRAKEVVKDALGIEDDDRPDELKAVWTTAYVNNLPDSAFLFVEDGEKDEEGKTKPRSKRHFPYKDTNGKVDLPHLRNAIARIPQSNAPGLSAEKKAQLQERARKLLEEAQKENKDLYIWKEGDTWRWIAAYSNNRRDNDSPPEIISSQSHKAFDEALNKGECPMPELWMWHLAYPVGKALYHAYDADTGFPVAAGTFNKDMDWAAEGMLKAGWNGVSHGMPSDSIERDPVDNTVITRHVTREISILPNWAAANKLAFSFINKELDMAENKEVPAVKREEFIKAFGAERWAVIEAALADKAKQADEAGIEKKETEPATEPAPPAVPETPTPLTRDDLNAALAQFGAEVAKTVADLQMEVAALKEAKLTEKPPVAISFLEMLKERSAIGKAENKLDGRSKEAKDGPEEDASPPLSPVPLLDAIMKANHRGA